MSAQGAFYNLHLIFFSLQPQRHRSALGAGGLSASPFCDNLYSTEHSRPQEGLWAGLGWQFCRRDQSRALGLCTCPLILLTAAAARTTFPIRIRVAVCSPNRSRLKCLARGAAGVTATAAATGMVNELGNEGEQKFWFANASDLSLTCALGG